VLGEIEVPPRQPPFIFHRLLLVAQSAADQDVVYSLFRRQDSWFARLTWIAVQNLAMSDSVKVEASGTGSGGEERTDYIRVSNSTSKSDDPGLLERDPVSSSSVLKSMWKRISISKFEERLAREVLEQARVQWKEDLRKVSLL